MVDTHKVNQETYDRISGVYALMNYKAMHMTEKLDQFLELIPKGGKILDLGCGPGHNSKYMITKGYEVKGVDFSEKMINIAKKRVEGVIFETNDIRKMEIEQRKYDGIWCNAVLLHFRTDEKIETLSKIHDGLKKGGVLHVSFSEGEGKRYLEKDLRGISDRKVYFDNTEEEVLEMIKKAGFEITSFTKERFYMDFMVFLCEKP